MFKEICQLISDLTGFTKGAKLQVGHWVQDKPERAVLVLESGGFADWYLMPEQIEPTVQVLCRAKTYFEAREDAYAAFDALHKIATWPLPQLESGTDYLVYSIEALTIPQYLGVDDNRRHLFSTNYIFRIGEGTCVPASGLGS